MKEKIIEMLHIQEALDNSFMKYMGNDKLDVKKVRMALFDELGEVCHELKAEWCYWKKSQKSVDQEKLKEELSDVLHFVLTFHRITEGFYFNDGYLEDSRRFYSRFAWYDILRIMSLPDSDTIYEYIILTEKLGFTFDEMYDAYIKKNRENYERMKRGY